MTSASATTATTTTMKLCRSRRRRRPWPSWPKTVGSLKRFATFASFGSLRNNWPFLFMVNFQIPSAGLRVLLLHEFKSILRGQCLVLLRNGHLVVGRSSRCLTTGLLIHFDSASLGFCYVMPAYNLLFESTSRGRGWSRSWFVSCGMVAVLKIKEV